jgi:hypothetical protein
LAYPESRIARPAYLGRRVHRYAVSGRRSIIGREFIFRGRGGGGGLGESPSWVGAHREQEHKRGEGASDEQVRGGLQGNHGDHERGSGRTTLAAAAAAAALHEKIELVFGSRGWRERGESDGEKECVGGHKERQEKESAGVGEINRME